MPGRPKKKKKKNFALLAQNTQITNDFYKSIAGYQVNK